MKPTPIIPRMVPEVLQRAAQLIRANGLGTDFVADPFNRRMSTPRSERPMNVVGAVRCAVSGDPFIPSDLAIDAICYIGRLVLVDGQPSWGSSIGDLERHVSNWSDEHDAEYVVAWLLAQALSLNARMAVAA